MKPMETKTTLANRVFIMLNFTLLNTAGAYPSLVSVIANFQLFEYGTLGTRSSSELHVSITSVMLLVSGANLRKNVRKCSLTCMNEILVFYLYVA